MIEDLAMLTHLNEASVLHTLKRRYDHWMIYVCIYALLLKYPVGTHIGNFLTLSWIIGYFELKQTSMGIILEWPLERDLPLAFPQSYFVNIHIPFPRFSN